MKALSIVGFARDPRLEPKAGDIVERTGNLRAVIAVRHSPFAGKAFVSYRTASIGTVGKVSIDAWRAWASSAAVTKVAA